MSHRALLIIFFVLSSSCAHYVAIKNGEPNYRFGTVVSPLHPEGRVLILMSEGGHSHVSAALTMQRLLKSRYTVDIINAFELLEGKIRIMPSEQIYNFLLHHDLNYMVNVLGKNLAPTAFYHLQSSICGVFREYIAQTGPSIVISDIPFINAGGICAAKAQGLPYILAPVDSDLSTYLINITPPIYDNFFLTIAFNTQTSLRTLNDVKMPMEHTAYTGVPVRGEFMNPPTRMDAKHHLGIEKDRFVVMLMMGGAGSKKMITYVKTLLGTHQKLHLIAAVGRNEALLEQLNAIELPKHISATWVGYTPEIIKYMAASDLLITKPGPSTVFEAIHLKLPLLIDASGTVIHWEKPQIDFVTDNKLGGRFVDLESLQKQVDKLSSQESATYKTYTHALSAFKIPDFDIEFMKLFEKAMAHK